MGGLVSGYQEGPSEGTAAKSGGDSEQLVSTLFRFRRTNGIRKGPWVCLTCGVAVEDLSLHAEWHVATDTERWLRPPNPTEVSGCTERTILVDVSRRMAYRVADRDVPR